MPCDAGNRAVLLHGVPALPPTHCDAGLSPDLVGAFVQGWPFSLCKGWSAAASFAVVVVGQPNSFTKENAPAFPDGAGSIVIVRTL